VRKRAMLRWATASEGGEHGCEESSNRSPKVEMNGITHDEKMQKESYGKQQIQFRPSTTSQKTPRFSQFGIRVTGPY
jgi:hypothetical protein